MKRTFYISLRLRTLLSFTVYFSLLLGAVFVLAYLYGTRLVVQNVRQELIGYASTISKHLDADQVSQLATKDWTTITLDKTMPYWGIDDPAYRQITDTLALYKQMAGTVTDPNGKVQPRLGIYLYVQANSSSQVMYVGSASAPNSPPGGAAPGEKYTPKPAADGHSDMLNGLGSVTVNVDRPITDNYGTAFSGFAPILDKNQHPIASVGVDMQDYTVLQLQNQLKAAAIPTFGVTVLLVLIISLLLSSNLTRSIRMLSGSVKYISDGKYEQYRTSRPKIGRIQDESARLVVVLDKMVDDVQKREISLKSEIQTLKIEIDQNALKNKVLEVTETEYFQKLQEKAKAMRNSPKKTIEPENVE